MTTTMRIGIGFDAHAFAIGRKLIIGGVDIPHEAGLGGHSDADVLTHAIIDALLGAASLGDIGAHFPDSDSAYRDITSLFLLEATAGKLKKEGFSVVNVDATIALESPKIVNYRDKMRANLAKSLGTETDRVGVKASTTEGMGFTGRGEGVAVWAVALIEKGLK